MGYFLTLLGVMFKSIADMLAGGDGSSQASMVRGMFTVVAIILTFIGVIKAIKNSEDKSERMRALGIHVLLWIPGYFLITYLAGIVILLVVVFVVALVVFHVNLITVITGLLSKNRQSTYEPQYTEPEQPKEEPKEKVEVIRENGYMQEHLKVNSDNTMYYDPELSAWVPINK